MSPVACLLALAAVFAAWPVADVRAQSMLDQIMLNRCSSAMKADFQKAGKTPPPGSVEKTCNCVVQQMNAVHNIDMAKTICMQQSGFTQPAQ